MIPGAPTVMVATGSSVHHTPVSPGRYASPSHRSSPGVSTLLIDLTVASGASCIVNVLKLSKIITAGELSPNDGMVAAAPIAPSGTV